MTDQVDSTSTESVVSFDARSAAVSADDNAESVRDVVGRFLELIRFSHTVFALPFALLSAILALILPLSTTTLTPTATVIRLIGVLLCMVTARSAAMAFNRLVDAKIDGQNPRTAGRHLPAGILTFGQVWGFWGVMSVGFLAACLLFLPNWLPLLFAVPVLIWICGYSLAKRFTSAAHLWLGVALALSPICAWVAIRGEEVIANPADVLPACGLALAIAFWVAGFDIIYACQDAEFDATAGLNSIPARFGIGGALRIAAFFHVLMLVVLALLPVLFPQLSLGGIFAVGWLVISGLLLRQHLLVSANDLTRVNIAFFNMNALISFGLSAVIAVDAALR